MDTPRRILVFGEAARLKDLAANLRASLLLGVVECANDEISMGNCHSDVILVDAARVSPEQFSEQIALCLAILSIDPDTYPLTLHSFPHQANPLAGMARVVEIISLTLPGFSMATLALGRDDIASLPP